VPAEWGAEGGEMSFSLRSGSILEPLVAHRDDLVLLDGFDMESSYHGEQNEAHATGMGHMLTGAHLQPGDIDDGSGRNPTGFPDGPSVDQVIADRIGATTPFRSIELSVRALRGNPLKGHMLYRRAAEPVAGENDPWAAFDRIFGGAARDAAAIAARERAQFLRGSALDHVRGELEALRARLGAEDRRRIDDHLDHIRALESRLAGPASAVCEPPSLGSRFDPMAMGSFADVLARQVDVAVAALACEQTRIVSIQCANTNSYQEYPWLGIDIGHHTLSHNCSLRPEACTASTNPMDLLRQINRWYAEQFARLLAAMKSATVPGADGTLLDHSLVVWCTEHTAGAHSRRGMKWVLAGGAGGAIRTGRYLRFSGDPHNNLLLSLCHTMGVDLGTFGNPAYCTGPLSGL
jgi:hypothetical protein